ncbi:TOBE domain-containing protein [Campylobacter pinnipediorum]|uniref:TOBE domain-containing protein n=1 Tax=Campylobacter pinnipediorum TaxID=1965231 RepID=UPI00084D2C55|nr:TOBE domain-containing protein [Campylobacter pinnipediorum]AQW84767.1 molybdenum-pterin binding domain-containing protein [Campylobacter pinnipediorum subsp. pinnipediorum]
MIKAVVDNITTFDDVSLVRFSVDEDLSLSMLSLGNVSLKPKDKVKLGFKSSNVSISTNKLENFSIKNEIYCKIIDLQIGEILSVILLRYKDIEFESIITSKSAKRLNLKLNDMVFAYIKSTSIYISEIL